MTTKGLQKYLYSGFVLLALAVILSACQTAPSPAPTEPESMGSFTKTFEAEHARVKAAFVTGTGAGSSAGGYLTQPSSIQNTTSAKEEATLTFDVPFKDGYTLWARLYGPSGDADAVYLGFDGRLSRSYVSEYGKYQWVKVSSQRLSAGTHRISLGHGEAGARVDMLVVSSEALGTRELDALVTLPAAADPSTPASPEPEREAGYLDILGELEGFGGNTTGGKDGEVVVVTNLNDIGSGSLREAVSLPGPKWVVFQEGLRGTINLSSNINVPADTTIDGRGADITISGQTIWLKSNNVILTHLKFRDAVGDAVTLWGAENVWINQSVLQSAGDGLIDMRRGSTNITVSWSSFSSHGKVMLAGMECGYDTKLNLTLHHNYFNATGERNPKVNCGKAHTYNNYIVNWQYVGAYVQAGGEVYSEANIYEAGERKRASNYASTDPGYLRSVNDLMQNGAFHNAVNPEKVFNPGSFYSYKADIADMTLKSELLRLAGWQSTSAVVAQQLRTASTQLAGVEQP